MTLRNRNRLNIGLCIFSLFVLLVYVALLVFKLVNKSFVFPQMPDAKVTGFFLTRYNPVVVVLALYFELVYAAVCSYLIWQGFEKTQAVDVIFFYLFLFSCLCDATRLCILFLNLSGAYQVMLACGNLILFSRLLAPLSLFSMVTMNNNAQFQDVEKNIFILMLISAFFANFIPLNSTVILPNFSISYAYSRMLTLCMTLIILTVIFALFQQNRENSRRQITTVGFSLLALGFAVIFNCTTILSFVFGAGTLVAGSYLYLVQIHNQYLWNL